MRVGAANAVVPVPSADKGTEGLTSGLMPLWLIRLLSLIGVSAQLGLAVVPLWLTPWWILMCWVPVVSILVSLAIRVKGGIGRPRKKVEWEYYRASVVLSSGVAFAFLSGFASNPSDCESARLDLTVTFFAAVLGIAHAFLAYNARAQVVGDFLVTSNDDYPWCVWCGKGGG